MENCFYWREPSQSARAGLHDLLRSSLRRIGLREVTLILKLDSGPTTNPDEGQTELINPLASTP